MAKKFEMKSKLIDDESDFDLRSSDRFASKGNAVVTQRGSKGCVIADDDNSVQLDFRPNDPSGDYSGASWSPDW